MRLNLPHYLPFGLLVGWFGCRAALQMWREQVKRKEILFMVILSTFPLALWLLIQFFPQE